MPVTYNNTYRKQRSTFRFCTGFARAYTPFALRGGAMRSIKFHACTQGVPRPLFSSLSFFLSVSHPSELGILTWESLPRERYLFRGSGVGILSFHSTLGDGQYPRGLTESAWQHNGVAPSLHSYSLVPCSPASYVQLYGQEHTDQNFTLAIARPRYHFRRER